MAIAAYCLQLTGCTSEPVAAVIKLNTTHQRMDGFGTGLGDSDPTEINDELADLLWSQEKGIGLSILRMMIDPDGQPKRDPNDFAKTGGWDLWGHVHKALARNPALRVMAVPQSPPAHWKDNGNESGGGSLCARSGQGKCDGSHYADWAASLRGFVALAASQTPPVPIYAISPQNEPDYLAHYHSCLYKPEQLRDFIKVLGPALATLEPRPWIMAPEVSDWSHLSGYVSAIEADEAANRYTDLFATHQYYHAVAPPRPSATRPLWQTEMSGLSGGPEPRWDPSIGNGIAVAKWIHSAIVDGEVSAWVWWRALNEWGKGSPPSADTNEDLIVDVNGTLTPNATITKRLYTLGNFSKFIRAGSIRVGIGGKIPDSVSVTAYKQGDDRLIIVAINDKWTSTKLSVSITDGQPPVAVVPWVTSAEDNLVAKRPVAVSGAAFDYGLARHSVTTFVSQ